MKQSVTVDGLQLILFVNELMNNGCINEFGNVDLELDESEHTLSLFNHEEDKHKIELILVKQ